MSASNGHPNFLFEASRLLCRLLAFLAFLISSIREYFFGSKAFVAFSRKACCHTTASSSSQTISDTEKNNASDEAILKANMAYAAALGATLSSETTAYTAATRYVSSYVPSYRTVMAFAKIPA